MMDNVVCPECASPDVGPDEDSPDGAEWSCLQCRHIFAAPAAHDTSNTEETSS